MGRPDISSRGLKETPMKLALSLMSFGFLVVMAIPTIGPALLG